MSLDLSLEEIQAALGTVWNENMTRFFKSGEPEQFVRFSSLLLEQAALAIKSGDEVSLATVQRVGRLLAELGRVTVVENGWALFDGFLEVFVAVGNRLLEAALGAALARLTVDVGGDK